MFGAAPPPFLLSRVMIHTFIYWIVLVKRRNLNEERHIACSLSPIVFTDPKDASSVRDRIWTKERFDEFGSSPWRNSGFGYMGELVYRVSNGWEIILPFGSMLFYFVLEGRPKKWLQMRVDVSDRQFHHDLQYIKTFRRFYVEFYKNYMKSFIWFILWFNLNCLAVFIILDEHRGIVDKCTLDRAANLLPWLLFVVELESYYKDNHFVNVYSDVPLFCQSL